MKLRLGITAFLLAGSLSAQIDPQSAHVNLYFPQLADGGTFAQRWQTTFIFQNPHPLVSAIVNLAIRGNNGNPLPLDFGGGAASSGSITIPGGGTRILRTTGTSPNVVTGWAVANATLPVVGTVLFRSIESGVPRVDIAAPPTLPAPAYRSFANADLGVAIGNPYSDTTLSIQVRALDPNGGLAGSASVSVGPLAHTSFNLRNLITTLPAGFVGTLELLTPATPTALNFVAWTLNAQDGVLSSLPSGGVGWPISHWDRIWLAYWKVINAAQPAVLQSMGTDLFNPIVPLDIDPSRQINAFASPQGRIIVTYALSELISDSPSELGFAIGHELGHIIQMRTGRQLFDPVKEHDADAYGMLFNLFAGYDPYAGAGTLAKINMASGSAGLVSEILSEHYDVHGSTSTRLQKMYQLLAGICSSPQYGPFCADYKSSVHPHFPGGAPLSIPSPTAPALEVKQLLPVLKRQAEPKMPEAP